MVRSAGSGQPVSRPGANTGDTERANRPSHRRAGRELGPEAATVQVARRWNRNNAHSCTPALQPVPARPDWRSLSVARRTGQPRAAPVAADALWRAGWPSLAFLHRQPEAAPHLEDVTDPSPRHRLLQRGREHSVDLVHGTGLERPTVLAAASGRHLGAEGVQGGGVDLADGELAKGREDVAVHGGPVAADRRGGDRQAEQVLQACDLRCWVGLAGLEPATERL